MANPVYSKQIKLAQGVQFNGTDAMADSFIAGRPGIFNYQTRATTSGDPAILNVLGKDGTFHSLYATDWALSVDEVVNGVEVTSYEVWTDDLFKKYWMTDAGQPA